MKKLALVLGGGAAKGYAHIGVIKTLEKHGLKPDLIVGTSMGALIGAIYATGKDAQHMEKLASQFNGIGNFSLISTVFKGNILNVKKVNRILERELGDTLQQDTQIPFVCIATNLLTGKEQDFISGSLKNNVLASISIPGLFPSCKINNEVYCDGGLVNNLPEDVARQILPDAVIISVDVIGDYSKQVEHIKFKALENLINANTIMTQNVVNNRPVFADVRLSFTLPNVSLLNFSYDLAHKTIRKGELATQKKINEIKELLGVTNENIKRTKNKGKK